MRKLVLVALNEFDPAFFRFATSRAELPGIERLLGSQHSNTWTHDEVEKRGLDPWVQWVSIHTGSDSADHKIKHLGDVPDLSNPQIWEALSAKGISSGIWGAMNASRGRAGLCRFFLPDPWTFSEPAHPPELNRLLALPRYYATNYLEVSSMEILKALGKLLGFVLSKPRLFPRLFAIMPLALEGLLKFGWKNHLLFSLFDLVSVSLFLHYKQNYRPDFSLVFINSVAHMQHNIWCEEGTLDRRCLYTLQVIDRVLRQLYAEGSELLVVNALTQRNIANRKRAIVYRQISPWKFVAALGLPFRSVEQLMTNDAHVFFDTAEQARAFRDVLAAATIDGYKLFDVDYSETTPAKVFYQLDFWDEVPVDGVIDLGGRTLGFYDFFEKLVERTGEHIPRGDVYSTGAALPDNIPNHKIYDYIIDFYAQAS